MIEKNIDSCWEGMLQHFYKSDDFVTDKSWPMKKSEACNKTVAGKPREYNENIDNTDESSGFGLFAGGRGGVDPDTSLFV